MYVNSEGYKTYMRSYRERIRQLLREAREYGEYAYYSDPDDHTVIGDALFTDEQS